MLPKKKKHRKVRDFQEDTDSQSKDDGKYMTSVERFL